MLWIYLAVRDKAILAARKAAGRTTDWPWTGFAFGAVMMGFDILQLFLAQPADLTAEAERRARAKYGANYSYFVTNVGVGSQGDRVYAEVIGYNNAKVFDADVDWKQ
jgi:hypothetical protein